VIAEDRVERYPATRFLRHPAGFCDLRGLRTGEVEEGAIGLDQVLADAGRELRRAQSLGVEIVPEEHERVARAVEIRAAQGLRDPHLGIEEPGESVSPARVSHREDREPHTRERGRVRGAPARAELADHEEEPEPA